MVGLSLGGRQAGDRKQEPRLVLFAWARLSDSSILLMDMDGGRGDWRDEGLTAGAWAVMALTGRGARCLLRRDYYPSTLPLCSQTSRTSIVPIA